MRLIISTNSGAGTVEGKNALTEFIKGKGWGYWHWFGDLWLVSGVEYGTDLASLRDEIRTSIPGIGHVMIMTTEGLIDHAGFVQAESIDWIRRNWQR